jgi:hypothetical protein
MRTDGSTNEALRVIDAFEALPPAKRADIFRNLSSQAREELIEVVSRPGDIMKRVSEEEIFLTIKELGAENALNLIRATTSDQLQYLLDVELWSKDQFNPASALKWMSVIADLGHDKVRQFYGTVDEELLIKAMSTFVRVHARDPERDLLEQLDYLPPFTLDDSYFLDVLVPEAEETVKAFLITLYEMDPVIYAGLMEELMWGLSAEAEENALRLRRARMAERGFPDYDEAMEIYRYASRADVRRPVDSRPRDDDDSPMGVIQYPVRYSEPGTLLRKSLEAVESQERRDRIAMNVAHLGNKVMIADARDPGDPRDLRDSLSKVIGHINIGLEDLCGDDLEAATKALLESHPELLFRRGFSVLYDAIREAEALARTSVGGVENLGAPLAGLVAGLLERPPRFAAQHIGEARPRQFKSIEEVAYIRRLMKDASGEDRWEPL